MAGDGTENAERTDIFLDNESRYQPSSQLPLLSPPSNKKLLCIAFASFQVFAVMQITVSVVAGSEAMFGDSLAMMVDALTYLFNLFAEQQKEVYAAKLQKQKQRERELSSLQIDIIVLNYQKYTYQLELIPPILSVTILLAVTIIVLRESISTLILDTRGAEQADPNLNLMMIFSFLNLLLDIMNVGCFASANHATGYKTEDGTSTNMCSDSRSRVDVDVDVGSNDKVDKSVPIQPFNNGSPPSIKLHKLDNQSLTEDNDDDDNDVSNLNMCSAYTHVFADTLRSFAVIFASLIAKSTNSITSEVADATAAVVVSVLIMLSLIPLTAGMIKTYGSLKNVNNLLKSNGCHENDQVELVNFL